MDDSTSPIGIPFAPAFETKSSSDLFVEVARSLPPLALSRSEEAWDLFATFEQASSAKDRGVHASDQPAWDAAVSLLIDLHVQGWGVTVSASGVK